MLHLAAAALLGVALALPGGPLPGAWRAGLWPAQLHLLTVGWLTQLVFGVALWMFPRPRGDHHRVRATPLDWAAWVGLNIGVALRLVGEPAATATAAGAEGAAAILLTASAGLQWLAVIHFALRLWPRVTRR